MYVDNINKNNGYYALSAFNNVLICSNAIDANKTVTFPSGYNLDTNLSFNVVFVNGHNCANSSDNLTLNDVLVVANKNGTLIPLPIHAMDDGLGGTVYKSLQANTVLNLYYTSNYDGSNTPAFVIIGNPIVLSSSDYTIYADGYYKWLSYSISERWTGKYWLDGKPIYRKSYYSANQWGGGNTIVVDSFASGYVDKCIKLHHWVSDLGRDSSQTYVPAQTTVYYSNLRSELNIYNDANSQVIGKPMWIVFEYTKTTDTAWIIPPFSI